MTTTMNAEEIITRIVDSVQRQVAAMDGDDYAAVEILTSKTSSLCRALDEASKGLSDGERSRLSAMLQGAIDQAAELANTAGDRLSDTRQEIQEVRNGRCATSAYRQSVPREAAMSYSRQG